MVAWILLISNLHWAIAIGPYPSKDACIEAMSYVASENKEAVCLPLSRGK